MTGVRSVFVLLFVLLFAGSLTCAVACPHSETLGEQDCPLHGMPDCCSKEDPAGHREDCVDTHFTPAKQADTPLETTLAAIEAVVPTAVVLRSKNDLNRQPQRLFVSPHACVLRI